MTTNSNKPPILFWIVSIIALLWNLMGVFQYLAQAYMTDEAKFLLPEADQLYFENVPAWVTGAFAIAVFSASLGCIALLIRKKWATPLFIISLVTVITQLMYNLLIQEYVAVEGLRLIMPLIILAIAIFLVLFSKNADKRGYLS